MDSLTPYRLTVVGAIVVLVLSVGIVITLGGAATASPYLQLVGAIAIPALIGLFKLEQNSVVQREQHAQNQADIQQTNSKIDELQTTLQRGQQT